MRKLLKKIAVKLGIMYLIDSFDPDSIDWFFVVPTVIAVVIVILYLQWDDANREGEDEVVRCIACGKVMSTEESVLGCPESHGFLHEDCRVLVPYCPHSDCGADFEGGADDQETEEVGRQPFCIHCGEGFLRGDRLVSCSDRHMIYHKACPPHDFRCLRPLCRKSLRPLSTPLSDSDYQAMNTDDLDLVLARRKQRCDERRNIGKL